MDNDEYLMLLNHSIKENDDWYQQTAKQLGMSDSAFWILYMLYDYNDGITQSEICSLSCFPKQTINSSLKNLASDGIIQFAQGTDGRSKKIVLTAAGHELMKKTIIKVRRTEHEALNRMSDEEKEILISALDKFTRLLNEIGV